MNKIYKYPIQIVEEQTLTVPACADFFHVGLDPLGEPCMWAVVNTKAKLTKINIRVIGTGSTVPDDDAYMYLGSFVHGPFMWHVFFDQE